MKALKYFLFTLFGLLIGKQGMAQIIGSQIDYQCLGNSRYEVILDLSVLANTNPIADPPIFCRIGNNTITGDSQTLISRTYADDATATRCGINDTIYLATGIRRLLNYKYRFVFDLASYSGCNAVFYIHEYVNSFEATTYGLRDYYYQSTVVNRCLAPCDASPTVSSQNNYLLTHNADISINFTAQNRNPTADSFSYEFIGVRTDDSAFINYAGSFSPIRWLNFFGYPNQNLQWPAGLHINPQTGVVLFRPTTNSQRAVVVMKITSYRNIGGTMQAVSWKHVERLYRVYRNSFNLNPVFISSPTSYQACVNQEVCFTITAADSNTNDSVELTIVNSELPGMTVQDIGNVKQPSKRVCWTPDSMMVGNIPYRIQVNATDNACIIPGSSIRAYSVFVRENPQFTYTIDAQDSCSVAELKLTPVNNVTGFNMEWKIFDSIGNNQYTSQDWHISPTLTAGKYFVDVIGKSSTPCVVTFKDSFRVGASHPPVFTLSKHTFTGCEGDDVVLGVLNTDSSYVYLWNDGLTDSARTETMKAGIHGYSLLTRNGSCTRTDSFWTYSSARPSLAKEHKWTGEDTLKITMLNPMFNVDYIWYLDHSTKGRNEGPQIEFVLIDDSKDHFVKVEGINYRCTVSDTFTVPAKTPNPQTSLPDHSGRTINAFPNPFSYHLSVQAIQMERINIYSMSGALLYSKLCNGSDEEQLYLPELAAGMYILEVQSKGISNRIKVNLVR